MREEMKFFLGRACRMLLVTWPPLHKVRLHLSETPFPSPLCTGPLAGPLGCISVAVLTRLGRGLLHGGINITYKNK